jgi:signal transduction histidine kinase/HAMP domain-containing protein
VQEILAVVLLTALIVAATTLVHHAHVRGVVLQDAAGQAQLVARQIFDLISRALADSAGRNPVDVVRGNREMRALVDASVAYASHLLYVSITGPDGRALVQSDTAGEGEVPAGRREIRDYLALDPLRQLHDTYWSDEIYEVRLPLDLDGKSFGAIRVGIAMPLVRAELRSALARTALLGGLALVAAAGVAVWLSQMAIRPLRRLAQDMERLRRGEFDIRPAEGPTDEFGRLANQLQLLGQEIQSDRLRVQAERAQFQSAVDQIEDGILFVNADRRIVFANQAIIPVLGKPLAGGIGASLEEALAGNHPLREMIDRAFAGGACFRNVAVAGPDGGPAEFLVSVFPVEDAVLGCGGVIAVLKDFRSLAVSMRTLQSLIRYSARLTALGRATSAMTHEIKNPLNAMRLHLELVRERLNAEGRAEGSAGGRESLDVIQAEIGRLDGIVQRFLALIRPQEIALHQFDLNAVLDDVTGLLEAEWKARGVSFTRALDQSLPSVLGDAELLRRAFMNILVNACEAMPDGGALTVTSEREEEAGFARVTVTDTGIGIAPEDLERVFTMYYTTRTHGTGIGLALAQRIVEVHEGTIELQSAVGRGTTVIVRLPLR